MVHRLAHLVQGAGGQKPLRHGQELFIFSYQVRGIILDEAIDVVQGKLGCRSTLDLQQDGTQTLPLSFQLAMLGREPPKQFAHTHGVGTGYGLQQRWEQVLFFVRVMKQGRAVEVAQYALGRASGLLVGSMSRNMRGQARQGIAAASKFVVACRKQLDGFIKTCSGSVESGNGLSHGMSLNRAGVAACRARVQWSPAIVCQAFLSSRFKRTLAMIRKSRHS